MQDEREQIARIISSWSDWRRKEGVRFKGSGQKYTWDQYYIWDREHSAICNPDGPASHVYPWARLDTPEASLEAAKLLNEREDAHWRAQQADALAKADQILALLQPPAPQWRPIAEAPRDGTHILACNALMPYSAIWTFDQRPPYVVHWWDNPGEEGFYLSSGDNGGAAVPTHWQPLPTPPEPDQ